jgi:hypothetical protein
MTGTDELLKKTFRECDSANSLSRQRMARLEASILERALATPQLAGAADAHAAPYAWLSPLPLGPGILAACTLILLGIITGQSILPVYSTSPYAGFSVVAVTSPWQNLMSGQGVDQP